MIRITLSPEPQWLDLGHGVRLQLLPLTTALMVATRSDPAVQDLAADANNDTYTFNEAIEGFDEATVAGRQVAAFAAAGVPMPRDRP